MNSERDYAPLSIACVRALNDKLYEKRKAAALEIEKMVKDFAARNDTTQIKKILRVLGQDFALSQSPHARKGGLIGLAAVAIALGKDTAQHIPELIQPILACFSDSDIKVRYCACESLYNVVKVARGAVLDYFTDIFNGLSNLATDPDQVVKNGSETLDRLMKDIVTESTTFDLVSFMPLLRERITTKNDFARQFIISWISVLDTVPQIDMVLVLPEILDGLFKILEDTKTEIKTIAVWLMFFLSTALLLIVLTHFVFGITVEVAVCEPLKNPSNTKTFQLLDKYLNVNDIYENKKRKGKDLKIGEVIPKVHRNVSIYEALKLEDVYNISQVYDYLEGLNISKKMLEFRKGGLLQNGKFELLTPEVIKKLKELADSSLNDIHFEKYAQLLKTQITNINLTRLSNELRSNAEKIPDHSSSGFDLTKVKKLLRAKARFLELLERDSVAQILNEIEALKYNVTVLKDHLKFNHTSLKHALEKLIDLVDRAQKFLFSNGKHEIGLLLNKFVEDCEKAISDYLDRVVNKTKFEIGKSAPLSNAYNSTVVATCDSVMKPFNGFWVSVGWSLALFIPIIIFAVMLSVLYSKSEPYTHPGMYGESEYLYDAYGDRHIQVPLTLSQSDKKKKNHHKNNQENYENGGNGAYLQDYSAHLGRSDRPSASNEARYNDMAPKHWGDFPNARGSSNPPRYHHPSSTEYERPPPYYFPGPERA